MTYWALTFPNIQSIFESSSNIILSQCYRCKQIFPQSQISRDRSTQSTTSPVSIPSINIFSLQHIQPRTVKPNINSPQIPLHPATFHQNRLRPPTVNFLRSRSHIIHRINLETAQNLSFKAIRSHDSSHGNQNILQKCDRPVINQSIARS